jgi:hypothetical protein
MSNFIGEQFNQHGNYNVGKVDARTGNAPSMSVVEQADAISELAEFIQLLERTGLVAPTGDLANTEATKAAIKNQESKLRRVIHVLANGGKRALISSLDHVITPLILALIEEQCLGMH